MQDGKIKSSRKEREKLKLCRNVGNCKTVITAGAPYWTINENIDDIRHSKCTFSPGKYISYRKINLCTKYVHQGYPYVINVVPEELQFSFISKKQLHFATCQQHTTRPFWGFGLATVLGNFNKNVWKHFSLCVQKSKSKELISFMPSKEIRIKFR